MDTVIKRVADYYGIKDITEKTRKEEVADARHVCIYILSRYFKISNSDIISMFGFSNHSSVIWSVGVVKDMMKTNNDWSWDVNELTFSCLHGTVLAPKSYEGNTYCPDNLDENGFLI